MHKNNIHKMFTIIEHPNKYNVTVNHNDIKLFKKIMEYKASEYIKCIYKGIDHYYFYFNDCSKAEKMQVFFEHNNGGCWSNKVCDRYDNHINMYYVPITHHNLSCVVDNMWGI